MAKSGLILGLASFLGTLFTSIMVGIGWYILKSDDICQGSMHSFVETVTISAFVQLGLFTVGIVISLINIFNDVLYDIATCYMFVIGLQLLVGGVLNLAWFIWGIVVLVDRQCQNTIYNTFSIVLVVLCGLTVVNPSLCRVHLRMN